MNEVGMRQLRHRLREYLARVEAGEAFDVTVFGRPVAGLRPLGSDASTLARHIAAGRVTPPLDPDTRSLPAVVEPSAGTSATDALLEERRTDRR